MTGPAVSATRLRTDCATASAMSSAAGGVSSSSRGISDAVVWIASSAGSPVRPGTNHRSIGTSRPSRWASSSATARPISRNRRPLLPAGRHGQSTIHDHRDRRSPARRPATAPAAPPPRRPPAGSPAAPAPAPDGGTPIRRRTRLPSTGMRHSSKNGTTRARRRPQSRYNATAAQGSRPKSQRGVAKSMGAREVTGNWPAAVSIGRGGFQPAWVGIAHRIAARAPPLLRHTHGSSRVLQPFVFVRSAGFSPYFHLVESKIRAEVRTTNGEANRTNLTDAAP